MVGYFINQFDAELRQTFEDIVGFRVNDSQWDQAALGVKLGGGQRRSGRCVPGIPGGHARGLY